MSNLYKLFLTLLLTLIIGITGIEAYGQSQCDTLGVFARNHKFVSDVNEYSKYGQTFNSGISNSRVIETTFEEGEKIELRFENKPYGAEANKIILESSLDNTNWVLETNLFGSYTYQLSKTIWFKVTTDHDGYLCTERPKENGKLVSIIKVNVIPKQPVSVTGSISCTKPEVTWENAAEIRYSNISPNLKGIWMYRQIGNGNSWSTWVGKTNGILTKEDLNLLSISSQSEHDWEFRYSVYKGDSVLFTKPITVRFKYKLDDIVITPMSPKLCFDAKEFSFKIQNPNGVKAIEWTGSYNYQSEWKDEDDGYQWVNTPFNLRNHAESWYISGSGFGSYNFLAQIKPTMFNISDTELKIKLGTWIDGLSLFNFDNFETNERTKQVSYQYQSDMYKDGFWNLPVDNRIIRLKVVVKYTNGFLHLVDSKGLEVIRNSNKPGTVAADRIICRNGRLNGDLLLTEFEGKVLKWESSTDHVNWTSITNTTQRYLPPAITQTTYFRAVVENTICGSISSSGEAKIEVVAKTVNGIITGDSVVCQGETSPRLEIKNAVGNINYWQMSENNGVTWKRLNSRSTVYTPNTIVQNTLFRAVIQADGCDSVITPNYLIKFDNRPTSKGGIAKAKPKTVCLDSPTQLSLENQVGNVLYWEQKIFCDKSYYVDNNVNIPTRWEKIPNTEAKLNFTSPVYDSKRLVCFRAVVRNGGCDIVNSDPETLTVKPCTPVECRCDQQEVCPAETTRVYLSDYVQKVIRWETRPKKLPIVWTSHPSNQVYFNTPPVLDSMCIRAVYLEDDVEMYTTEMCVKVNKIPRAGILEYEQSICKSENATDLSLYGYYGEVKFWQKSTNKITWTEIPYSGTYYNSDELSQTTYFRVVVGVCGNSDTSNIVKINVSNVPKTKAGKINSKYSGNCDGSPVDLELVDYVGAILYWEYSNDDFSTISRINSTSPKITSYAITSKTTFRAIVKNSVCHEEKSAHLIINPATPNQPDFGTITSNLPDNKFCGTSQLELNVLLTNMNVIQWEYSQDYGITWEKVNGNVTTNLKTTINSETQYRIQTKTKNCPVEGYSPMISLRDASWEDQFNGELTSESSEVCQNGVANLLVSNFDGKIKRWETSTDGGANWKTLSGTTNPYSSPVTKESMFRAIVITKYCKTEHTTNPVNVGITIFNATSSEIKCNVPMPICQNEQIELSVEDVVGLAKSWQVKQPDGTWKTIADYQLGISVEANKSETYKVIIEQPGCSQTIEKFFDVVVAGTNYQISGDLTVCQGVENKYIKLSSYTGTLQGWIITQDPTWNSYATIQSNKDSVLVNFAVGVHYVKAALSSDNCGDILTKNVKITILESNVSASDLITSKSSICSAEAVEIKLPTFTGKIIKWESSDDNSTWKVLTGSLATINPIPTKTTKYRVTVGNESCNSFVTKEITINVTTKAIVGTLTGNTTICSNVKPVFNLENSTAKVLRWESSENGSNWITVSTLNSNNFTSELINKNTQFRVVLNDNCKDVISNIVKVTVIESNVSASDLTATQTNICPNETVEINLPSFTGKIIKWESSIDNTIWTVLTGVSPKINPSIAQTTKYRVTVGNQNCNSYTTKEITVNVKVIANIGILTGNEIVCSNIKPVLKLENSTAKVIRWESSEDGTTWKTASTLTSKNFTSDIITKNTQFRVVLNDNCKDINSNVVKVEVKNCIECVNSDLNVVATISKSACEMCKNGKIDAKGTGGLAPYRYKINNSPYTTSGVYSNLLPGNYTITVIDKNNCVKTQIFKVEFNNTCAPPTVLSLKRIGTKNQLKWSLIQGAPGYQIDYQEPSSITWKSVTVNRATDNTLIDGLDINKTYCFKVKTVCSPTLQSPFSPLVCFKANIGATTTCQTPTITQATPSSKGARVTWTQIVNATGYQLEYRPKGSNANWNIIKFNAGNLVSTTIKEMNPVMEYELRVMTICGTEKSAYSKAVIVKTLTREEGVSSESLSQIELNLYPNPVQENLNVELISTNDFEGKVNIYVYDLTGRVVYQSTLNDKELASQNNILSLSTQNWSSGGYVCRVMITNSDNQVQTIHHKFVVTK